MRRAAMIPPRTEPWRLIASAANAEQLGAKRQPPGSTGATVSRYARISAINVRATGPGRPGSTADVKTEGLRELGGRLGIREGLRTGLCNHHHVERWHDVSLTMAKNFAHDTLHAVPNDRVSDPFADRHAEARASLRRYPVDDHEMCGVPPPPVVLQREVLSPPTNPR
jgi:hypothetical protein